MKETEFRVWHKSDHHKDAPVDSGFYLNGFATQEWEIEITGNIHENL